MLDTKKITEEVDAGEAVVLDVRGDDEWNAGRPAPAIRFEYAKLKEGELPDIPKDKKIYTMCNAGGRAGKAKTILEEAGFTNVENAGGLTQWKEAGGEVTS